MVRFSSAAVAAWKAGKQCQATRRAGLLLLDIILLMAASTLGYLLYLLPRLRELREHSHKARP